MKGICVRTIVLQWAVCRWIQQVQNCKNTRRSALLLQCQPVNHGGQLYAFADIHSETMSLVYLSMLPLILIFILTKGNQQEHGSLLVQELAEAVRLHSKAQGHKIHVHLCPCRTNAAPMYTLNEPAAWTRDKKTVDW